MNYEEMSDFELNEMVLVATKTNGECHDGSGEVYARDDRNILRLVDYCNNPSDAWPIIFSSRTMLNPYCVDELWKAEVPCGFDGFVKAYATCYHRNPLRAAMIVFLMMQEQVK